MPRKKKSVSPPDWLTSLHQEWENSTEPTEKNKNEESGDPEEIDTSLETGLLRLEVDEYSLEAMPKIEHLLDGIGGRRKVFTYLEGSEDPIAREILKLKKRLSPAEAKVVPLEAYCVAAKITSKKLFGLIASEVHSQETMAKAVLFAAKHSEVVEASLMFALHPDGDSDRKMLHQAAGFVPVPKNSITHIHGNQINRSESQVTQIAVLPSVEDTVKRLGDRFNEKIIDVIPIAALPAPEEEDEDE